VKHDEKLKKKNTSVSFTKQEVVAMLKGDQQVITAAQLLHMVQLYIYYLD
jgi:hypothetical protein